MNKYVYNFGLSSDDLNWMLSKFVDIECLSHMICDDILIDQYADILDWSIISTKPLAGWLFVKHKDKIHWDIFITNGHAKDLNYLVDVRNILEKYELFLLDPNVMRLYYTEAFISAFPNLINWQYCLDHYKLPSYILLRHWKKLDVGKIITKQVIDIEVAKEHLYDIPWKLAIQFKKFTEEINILITPHVLDEMLVTHQTLSESYLADRISTYQPSAIAAMIQHQTLSDAFIETHQKILDFNLISKYQKLSIRSIRKFIDRLSMGELVRNPHYSRIDSDVKIFQQNDRYYIIVTPSQVQISYYVESEDTNCFIEEK
jgi:hypothetical protein